MNALVVPNFVSVLNNAICKILLYIISVDNIPRSGIYPMEVRVLKFPKYFQEYIISFRLDFQESTPI